MASKVAKRFEHKINEAVAAQTSVDESVDHDRSQDGTNQKSKSCTTQPSQFVKQKRPRPIPRPRRRKGHIKEVTDKKEGHRSDSEQTYQAIVMEHFQKESIDVVAKTECIAKEKNDFTSKIQPLNENNNVTMGMQHFNKNNTNAATKIQQLKNDKIDRQIHCFTHDENENRLHKNNQIKLENTNWQKITEDKNRVDLMARPLLGLQFCRQQSMEMRIQQLQPEKRRLDNEKQELRQDKTRVDKEIQQLRQEKSQLENKNQQRRRGNRQSEIENQQLRQEKTRTDQEIQQLRQEKGQLKNENQQLRQEKSQLRNENQQLREEKSQLENENQHLREENDDMSNEVQDLRQRNNNMEIEIQQLHEYTKRSFITENGTVIVSRDHVLGRGAWGAVYTGDFYGTKVAVKEYFEIILSPHNMEMLKREINIASQCRHPNLLQFIGATKNDQDRLLIVTELMDMALRAFLEQQARERSRLKHPEVKLIALDVARGLNYLHSQKPNPIVHRDVSSANVLLWIENGSVRRAKISDYGSANFMEACNTANPGAAIYAAPEARQAQHDPKIDVFSYGLLVCETSICELPHSEEIRRKGQIKRIPNSRIKKLVEQCAKVDPRKRPTMSDVIERWQEIK